MSKAPDTFDDLIGTWGIAQFAADLGVNYSTANAMKQRNSVPSKWWPTLLAKSRGRGVKITQGSLLEIQSRSIEARQAKRSDVAA